MTVATYDILPGPAVVVREVPGGYGVMAEYDGLTPDLLYVTGDRDDALAAGAELASDILACGSEDLP